jgi:predicted double-glycine peptidase
MSGSNFHRFFVAQLADNDCGVACLAMLLNYSGNAEQANVLRHHAVSGEGLSLLELRALAESQGLAVRCVELELDFLCQTTVPCILHTVNDFGEGHFEVYFGSANGYYSLADPARGIYRLREPDLLQRWPYRAALYVEGLAIGDGTLPPALWKLFYRQVKLPPAVWLLAPLLNLAIAILSLALTLILQKAPADWLSNRNTNYITVLLGLLLFLLIARGLTNTLKDRVLLAMYNRLDQALAGRLLTAVQRPEYLRRGLAEVRKIGQSVLAITGIVLAEGLLLALLLLALAYRSPFTGLAIVAYLAATGLLTRSQLGRSLYQQHQVNQFAGRLEIALRTGQSIPLSRKTHQEAAVKLAEQIGRENLYQEILGAGAVVASIAITVNKGEPGADILFNVLLAFFITVLARKVAGAALTIADGIEAAARFNARVSLHHQSQTYHENIHRPPVPRARKRAAGINRGD